MDVISVGGWGGGESEPVPSNEQLVGEGNDMEVLESSSREERPGDRREPCAELV